SVETGAFWRLVMPAFPRFVVLLAFVPLLVPGLAARLGPRIAPIAAPRVGRRAVLAAAILFAVVPLGVAGLWREIGGAGDAVIVNDILTPVDAHEVAVRATREGIAVRL